jgi:hypothetical protein
MNVIDINEYVKNKKSIAHAPFEKNEEMFRSALCFQIESLLRSNGFPSVRVLYHKTMYVFILNISVWAYMKIKMAELFGVFSWKESVLNTIKAFDKNASDIKIFRSWPSNFKIQRILNS